MRTKSLIQRLMVLFLTFTMVFCSIPQTAFADSNDLPLSEQDAVTTAYNEFSNKDTYGSISKTPLLFPLEYNGVTYTNVENYLKAWIKHETGRDDVEIIYTSSPAETAYKEWTKNGYVSNKYTGLDTNGNIIQGYFKDNGIKISSKLTNVSFKAGEAISQTIDNVYIRVNSLQRTPEDIVKYFKASMDFERIKNGNADKDHVVNPLGEKSASTVLLPNTTATSSDSLYGTTSATVTWQATSVSGLSNAVTVGTNRAVTIKRPNVGEQDAVVDLTATIVSKTDTSVKDSVTHRITVPAFEGVKVPVMVTEGASLSIKDSYYGANVVDKYIVKRNDAPKGYELYDCTLHTGNTGAAQSFTYTVAKDGYLTKTGSISVKAGEMDTVTVDLIKSTADDNKLASLSLSAPETSFNFNPDVTEYTVEVEGAQYVTFNAVPKVSDAAVKITSYYKTAANANKGTLTTTAASATTTCYLPDDISESVIKITVTAPAGTTVSPAAKVYTVKVKKTAKTMPVTKIEVNAIPAVTANKIGTCPDIALQEEGAFYPSFVSGANHSPYLYKVNANVEKVQLKITASGTITVNGNAVSSGKNSEEITLNPGDNLIPVTVTQNDETVNYTVNVYRKSLLITDVTLDKGFLTTLKPWSGSASFEHDADTISITYHTNLAAEEESKVKIYSNVDGLEGVCGQPITLNVEGSDNIMPTIWFVYEKSDKVIEEQKYVISLKRLPDYAANSVESYLPAPGQFVNIDSWMDPGRALNGSGQVTLGAFGGNIVYSFTDPILNDPGNPYGIDFLIMGNCFQDSDGSTSQGAAEPAAVMVSQDGITWYELAGSEYYNATTLHNVRITYTNGDTEFKEAADTPWTTTDGESGILPKNSYHDQPYYPNPKEYSRYQQGAGANTSYTAESVTFEGSMIANKDLFPFGYADSHTKIAEKKNEASNPYSADHKSVYNGDGFDISWAVDKDGNPVSLDSVKYVKVYNPLMYFNSSTGEASPEIGQVLRAKQTVADVGTSAGLTSLKINGEKVELAEGVYEYNVDGKGAGSFIFLPETADSSANIYVSNQRVVSGKESTPVTAVSKTRIIVQDGEKAPVIYIINFTNIEDARSNPNLASVTLTPGDVCRTPDKDGIIKFNVDNGVSSVKLQLETAQAKSGITLQGGKLSESVKLAGGDITDPLSLNAGENRFTVTVESPNKKNTREYTIIVHRAESAADEGLITVYFKLTGDAHHYDKEKKEYTGSHTNPAWVSQRTVKVPEGSTAKYLTEMVLNNEGISFTTSGNYISEINGLGEFDNGPNSGWMYRVNGKHAEVGYDALKLNNGDSIDWHYTDDYTKEEGSEKWTTPEGEGSTPTVTEGADGSVTAQATAEVEVMGDTAKATVDSKTAAELVKQAKDNKATEVKLEVKAEDTKDAKAIQAELPKSALSDIAGKTDAALVLATPQGEVKLDNKVLDEIAKAAEGTNVTIEIKAAAPTAEQVNTIGKSAQVIELTITSGSKTIGEFNGGTATFASELPKALDGKRTAAVCIKADGTLEVLPSKVVEVSGKKHIEFTTSHFSTFAIVDADEAGISEEQITQPEKKNEKLIAGVKATTIKAKSKIVKTKKGKKAIKISWSKSKGYKVDYYQIYRSKNKAKNFKKMFTTKSGNAKFYTNTKSIKKGRTYYYKVRGVRIINGKKYYTKWSNVKKQKVS